MKYSVFVSRPIPEAGIKILKRKGIKVAVNPEDRILSPPELVNRCRGKDGLLCLLTDTIDGRFFDRVKSLKAIANMAVGYDNIDLRAATERRVPVSNTPGVLTEAAADLAWALLMSTARRIPEAERFLRSGQFTGWGPLLFLGGDLRGRTFGIVGAGRIGTAVGLRSRGFGMRVLYTDQKMNPTLEREVGARKVELETLLRRSDYVTLHVPLTRETRHLIGAKELHLMKKTAYLLNTSRGPVIDENALFKTLKSKRIAGAGLDVFEKEPEVHPGLLKLENVVLLPHIGSATIMTRNLMAEMAAMNLIAMLKGQIPPHCVNPEVYSDI